MVIIKNIGAAWQLLLTLPWPWESRGGRPGFWFWLPGLVIGLILSGVGFLVRWLPASVTACLLLLAEIILTGGMHLDGWADCWDGWGCRYSPEKRLQAMKDSRLGSLGVAGLVVLLLLKFCLYRRLVGTWYLLPAHLASRGSLVALAPLFPRSSEGLGADFVKSISPWHSIANLLIAGSAFFLTSGLPGLLAFIVGLVETLI